MTWQRFITALGLSIFFQTAIQEGGYILAACVTGLICGYAAVSISYDIHPPRKDD